MKWSFNDHQDETWMNAKPWVCFYLTDLFKCIIFNNSVILFSRKMTLINIITSMRKIPDHPVSGFLFANVLKTAKIAGNGALNAEKELGWMVNHGYVCNMTLFIWHTCIITESVVNHYFRRDIW